MTWRHDENAGWKWIIKPLGEKALNSVLRNLGIFIPKGKEKHTDHFWEEKQSD